MNLESVSGINYIDFGGSGEIMHFAHANGFPPGTYKLLAAEFTVSHRVIGMDARPLWPNCEWQSFHTWETAADDLIRFLDAKKLKGILGAGHSFGAVATLIAANKRPELFSKLILIEPVILPKWIYWFSGLVPYSVSLKINPVAKKATNRKEIWKNREGAFKQFREKKVFSKMSDEALWDYVNAGTELVKTGAARLRYSKEWETRVYLTVSNPWSQIKKIGTPFLIIRGENSDTLSSKVWRQLQALRPTETFIEMQDCGHLIPSEKPKELAKQILTFLG